MNCLFVLLTERQQLSACVCQEPQQAAAHSSEGSSCRHMPQVGEQTDSTASCRGSSGSSGKRSGGTAAAPAASAGVAAAADAESRAAAAGARCG